MSRAKRLPTNRSVIPSLKWSGLIKIEDIQLKKSRYGSIYAILYTNAGINICAAEHDAQRLCLYEPYEMKGNIKQYLGGQYLRLEKAKLFEPDGYSHVIL